MEASTETVLMNCNTVQFDKSIAKISLTKAEFNVKVSSRDNSYLNAFDIVQYALSEPKNFVST